jgi:hypothetical protein
MPLGLSFLATRNIGTMGCQKSLLYLIELKNNQFFSELKDHSSYSFDVITFIRVSPSYSATTFNEQNYGRAGLHLCTMEKSRSHPKDGVTRVTELMSKRITAPLNSLG